MSQREIEAVNILNEIECELLAATNSFRIYQSNYFNKKLTEQNKSILARMHISYIILALAKLNEFYRYYNKYIPSHLHTHAKKTFQKEIKSRGIIDFRNKVVGHIYDKKTKAPLKKTDIEKRLNKIISPNLNDFLLWVNNIGSQEESVVGLCEKIKNHISTNLNITND